MKLLIENWNKFVKIEEAEEEVEMSDLYTDYSEDPIEALEKKREELKSKMRKRATAKDAEDFKKLNKEIVRLKKLKQEKQ